MDRNDRDHDEKRRQLLKAGAAMGAAGTMGGSVVLTTLLPQTTQAAPHLHPHTPPQEKTAAKAGLAKFVDALPIPRGISPVGKVNGVPLYDVTMRQFAQKLHRDLPATSLWGYNAQYPGPLFDVRRGNPIAVKWANDLPGVHFLPIDETIHGAELPTPPVRTVVHLHGMKDLPDSDGYPEAWFTNGYRKTGPFFSQPIYQYPNDQQAMTLWYHDHALGITRLNVYAGLSGMYILRDDHEDSLNLPKGDYEIPLIIQDRFFNPDGSLLYPVVTPGDPDPRVPPIWIPELFADTVLVNGKVWPYLQVEPRKYRFRILNSSNARFYHLTLQPSGGGNKTGGGSSVPAFIQIGSDGGLLPAPVSLTDLLIAPAERFDIVIDFSRFAGRNFVLANDGPAPFPDGGEVVPPDVMMFRVGDRVNGRDTSDVPSVLNSVPPIDPASAVTTRDLVLSELDSDAGSPIMAMINGAHWDDPRTESPKAGTTEIWRIINTTGDGHPIHVHLVQFQILDRTPFDTNQFPPTLVLTDKPSPPAANEHGWKDTVVSYPGTVTRIIATFNLPRNANAKPGQKFRYVYHCHIMEHEENEMMRPYDVVG